MLRHAYEYKLINLEPTKKDNGIKLPKICISILRESILNPPNNVGKGGKIISIKLLEKMSGQHQKIILCLSLFYKMGKNKLVFRKESDRKYD